MNVPRQALASRSGIVEICHNAKYDAFYGIQDRLYSRNLSEYYLFALDIAQEWMNTKQQLI